MEGYYKAGTSIAWKDIQHAETSELSTHPVQELRKEAMRIAENEFDGDLEYRCAAERMRIPYWDWLRAMAPSDSGPCVPTDLTDPTVKVRDGEGKLKVRPFRCLLRLLASPMQGVSNRGRFRIRPSQGYDHRPTQPENVSVAHLYGC